MKKIFKNVLMQFVFALSVFSIVGCQEYEMDSQPEQPVNMQVDANEAYTMLATSPSNIAFGISSNTPWSISVDQQWCTITPTSSAVSSLVSEVVIKAESNETAKERVATITIEGEGVENKVITVTQKSKENLTVVQPSDVVPTDGGNLVFHIVSNKAWEVTTTDEFLNHMDKTRGEGDESGEQIPITVKVPANAGALRSGHITVKTAFEEQTFEVTQDGVVIEMAEPTESGNIEFFNKGAAGEQLVTIRANREWQLKATNKYPSWLKVEKIDNQTLKVAVDANNILVNREAEFMLDAVEVIPGFDGIPFKVVQSPAFWFNCDEGNMIVDEETNNVKFTQKGRNCLVSHYTLTKGRIVIEFESLHLTAKNGFLNFNHYSNSSTQSNFRLELRPDHANNGMYVGGGYNWNPPMKKQITEAEVNSIKKIEFIVEEKSNGKLKLTTKIYDASKVIMELFQDDRGNPYNANPVVEQGTILNFNLKGAAEDYFTIKTITHYPAE